MYFSKRLFKIESSKYYLKTENCNWKPACDSMFWKRKYYLPQKLQVLLQLDLTQFPQISLLGNVHLLS